MLQKTKTKKGDRRRRTLIRVAEKVSRPLTRVSHFQFFRPHIQMLARGEWIILGFMALFLFIGLRSDDTDRDEKHRVLMEKLDSL